MSAVVTGPSTTDPSRTGGPSSPVVEQKRSSAGIATDLFRFALAILFLWPFLDKTFGLGYSTTGAKSWISGGSPTKGFLGHVEVGPLQSIFRSIAGNPVIDTLFMLTLLGVGVALALGVVLRIAALSGSILLVLMWAAEWPPAHFSSTGVATGSTNPFLDDHLIFALGLILVAAVCTSGSVGSPSSWGLGKWWAGRAVVLANPVLR